jgi:hypothetical protein
MGSKHKRHHNGFWFHLVHAGFEGQHARRPDQACQRAEEASAGLLAWHQHPKQTHEFQL